MKKAYKKPSITSIKSTLNIVPLAVSAVTGLTALGVGGAFVAGVASGLMKNKIVPDYNKSVCLKKVTQL